MSAFSKRHSDDEMVEYGMESSDVSLRVFVSIYANKQRNPELAVYSGSAMVATIAIPWEAACDLTGHKEENGDE